MVKNSSKISATSTPVNYNSPVPLRRSSRPRSIPRNVERSPIVPKSPSRRRRSRSKSREKKTENSKSKIKRNKLNSPAAKLQFANNEKINTNTVPAVNRSTSKKNVEDGKINENVAAENKLKMKNKSNKNKSKNNASVSNDTKGNSIDYLRQLSSSLNFQDEKVLRLNHSEMGNYSAEHSVSYDTADDSDSDESNYSRNPNMKRFTITSPNDYGAIIYTLSLLLIMSTFFFSCYRTKCYTKELNINFKNIEFSPYVFLRFYLYYLTYMCSIILLSILLPGQKVDSLPGKEGKFTYVMNGKHIAFICVFLLIYLEYNRFAVNQIIITNFHYLTVASLLTGILIGISAKIHSFFVPISNLDTAAIGKNSLYTFFMGRELHPRTLWIDWKITCTRIMIVTKFTLACSYAHMVLSRFIQYLTELNLGTENSLPSYDNAVILYSLLNLILSIDGLYFEDTQTTTREFQQEAFGYYMSGTYLLRPFIASFIIDYIVHNNIKLDYIKLAISAGIFILGLGLYRKSNNEKDAFRKNPYGHSRLDVIPTAYGKKIMCAGCWAVVRHPNYLGHILMELSVLPFIIESPLVLIVLVNVLFLIDRARKDNRRCSDKYGVAWDRYCNKADGQPPSQSNAGVRCAGRWCNSI